MHKSGLWQYLAPPRNNFIVPSSTLPTVDELAACGLPISKAIELGERIAGVWNEPNAARRWSIISKRWLAPDIPFAVHRLIFQRNYIGWSEGNGPPPAWLPTHNDIASANVTALLKRAGVGDIGALEAWACPGPAKVA